ncbi:hypothetical protein [Mucilaginibacter rivuli]|nr:hypothetical protein [Mucilaginibacter rivuli]
MKKLILLVMLFLSMPAFVFVMLKPSSVVSASNRYTTKTDV